MTMHIFKSGTNRNSGGFIFVFPNFQFNNDNHVNFCEKYVMG